MTDQEAVETRDSQNPGGQCNLCEKSRTGDHRISRAATVMFMSMGIFFFFLLIPFTLIVKVDQFNDRSVFLSIMFCLVVFFFWVCRYVFFRRYEYWFIHENEPHAHLRPPTDHFGKINIYPYIKVAIGGRPRVSQVFYDHPLPKHAFSLHYYPDHAGHNLWQSGLEIRDSDHSRLRFDFDKLADLLAFLKECGKAKTLTQAMLAYRSDYFAEVRVRQGYETVCQGQKTTIQNDPALRQVILILVDTIASYRRTLGNSRHGRFVDGFLRRAWLHIFDKVLDTQLIGSDHQDIQELLRLKREALAEVGIKEGDL